MSEVLSQNEIDDLLEALQSGVIDADEIEQSRKNSNNHIRDYNFARPAKFAKEQLRTLEIILENFARLLSTSFTVFFRTSTQAEIISAEAVAYQEFTNSLPNPSILGIVDFSPLKGSVVLEMSNKIGYAIIDRLLGGSGKTVSKVREYSEIEIAILEKIMRKCCKLLIEPWESVIKLDPYLEKVETNPQYAQIVSSNEIIALVTMSIKMGEVEGLMNICLPYIVIEPIMDKLNTKFWFSNLQKNEKEDYNELIEKKIENSGIMCNAVLGATNVTVNEFINLQKGDIIKLNETIDSKVTLYIGDVVKFKGQPGILNKRNALKITEVIRKEDD